MTGLNTISTSIFTVSVPIWLSTVSVTGDTDISNFVPRVSQRIEIETKANHYYSRRERTSSRKPFLKTKCIQSKFISPPNTRHCYTYNSSHIVIYLFTLKISFTVLQRSERFIIVTVVRGSIDVNTALWIGNIENYNGTSTTGHYILFITLKTHTVEIIIESVHVLTLCKCTAMIISFTYSPPRPSVQ